MNPIFAPALRCGMLVVMSKRSDAVGRWREVLRRQAGSGLSVAAFCRRARVSQASFYSWRRRLRHDVPFTEVRVASEPGPATSVLQVVLSGGRSIVVRPGFDRATLLAVVDALEHGTGDGSAQESDA